MESDTFSRPGAIIFDMDGLMLNSEVIFREAWHLTLVELGYGAFLDTDAYLQLVGCSNDLAEKLLLKWLGGDFPLERFRDGWTTRWDALVAQGIPTQPGLWPLLDWLDEIGLPKAVGTSSNDHEAQISLKSTGLWPRFDAIVTVDQAGAGKPAPDIFLTAAHALNITPSNCLVLEDSNAGVQAAIAAGMKAIMVPNLQTPTDYAQQHALKIVSSLRDVLIHLQAIWQT
ncbi:HAD family hydrolase [Leptothoe spongobia]|uniref:HAD family phosphatase n=1 Tax=Leptothoe spongobia TAU-MAC 1115 TaxID=1967444 RepID=A0A947DJ87_9CYAN|nr:HAD family phosphatase [Leptothoe spongobia]MBT9317584.1 HAD family phosphatase [Leptothoe spongobia TAU-MAC 1115]